MAAALSVKSIFKCRPVPVSLAILQVWVKVINMVIVRVVQPVVKKAWTVVHAFLWWRHYMYPVPGTRKQVRLCAYPCSLLSCVSLANHYRSCLGFASGARLFRALPLLLPLGGVALRVVPSSAMASPCSPVVLIVRPPGSKSSSYQGSSLRIRWVSWSFFGCFANVWLQRVKIDRADQLVNAVIAQVWALEFAVSAFVTCPSVCLNSPHRIRFPPSMSGCLCERILALRTRSQRRKAGSQTLKWSWSKGGAQWFHPVDSLINCDCHLNSYLILRPSACRLIGS